ncbi:MAG: MmgE/PrpD family protein [Pseudomonadota bacterium]
MHIRSGEGPAYTQDFARFIAGLGFSDLPAPVVHAARRGVLDWIGCALAASRHPTLDRLIAVLQETGGGTQATVLARQLRLSHIDAALVNGQMGHLLDYDDTHMGGVVLHASSPLLSALLSAAERAPVSGADLVLAYVCGFEAGVRVGQSAPAHHAGGWHLTGTLGTFAAAAAVGRLVGLDAQQMTHALGIAGTQASGMQQNRGTMCKSFHAGRAGSNGLLAALLAQKGFDSSEEIVEGKRGFSRIYSATAAPHRMTEGLGSEWLIETNGYKPYACGVVLHPAIDAMIDLHRQPGLDLAQVESIALRVHPLVVSITGTAAPTTGLHSKFSIYHSAAVALVDGDAGIRQYTDARATDPQVAALREKITVSTDDKLRRDQACATLVLCGGERREVQVAHASGTVDNPMSDAALQTKFLANATPAIGEARARQVCDTVWSLDKLADVRQLIEVCA